MVFIVITFGDNQRNLGAALAWSLRRATGGKS